MPLNSRLLLPTALFIALAACEEGLPNEPTPVCAYTLSATAVSVPAAGGSATIAVTTTSQCTWTASSDREWITVTAGASGTGSGTVTVAVGPNPSPTVRTGTLTVAGQTVAVTEAAQPACTVTLSPESVALGEAPASGTLSVASPSYCQWSAVSTATWLTVTSGSPGAGNGSIGYAVSENNDPSTRAARIVVNEKSFVVTQSGEQVSCDYIVSPVEFKPCMSMAVTMTAMVTTQATCSWTATPAASWITVVEGLSGTGSGLVSFRITDNWEAPRYGVVEVRWPTVTAGQNLHVRQAGCYYAVSPSQVALNFAGGARSFDVLQQSDPYTCGGPLQDACVWTAVSQVPWIVITTPMPQRGDNRVNLLVEPNNTGMPRTGTIFVRDKIVTVTQSGS